MARRHAFAIGRLVAILALLLWPVRSAGQGNETVMLRIAGDRVSGTTIVELMVARFLQFHGAGMDSIRKSAGPPGWTEEISGLRLDGSRIAVLVDISDTAQGLRYLQQGLADIALAARRITSAEIASALTPVGDLTSDDASYEMARSGFVVAVRRDNPVQSITFDQLRAVYAGRLTDWAQLGGAAGSIDVFTAPRGSGLRDVFDEVVMGSTPEGRRAVSILDYRKVADALHADQRGIGIIPLGADELVKPLRLRVGDHLAPLPDNYTLVSGDYPLALRLALYHSPSPKVHQREIADFVDEAKSISSQADVTLPEFFLYGVNPELLTSDGPVPKAYGFEDFVLRISTTIHFPPGSNAIGPYNEDAVSELATYLRFLQVPAGKIHFVAFSDDNGSHASNRTVSQNLGTAVRNELLKLQVNTSDDIVPLGTSAPLASDFTAEGRTLNRRVETWVTP
jgi:phosphate transport system substrate-binding protein